MTRLIVVKADEVGDRPRIWCQDVVHARHLIDRDPHIANKMHTHERSGSLRGYTSAIVLDPFQGDTVTEDPPTTPTPDPREEAFWSAAFMGALARVDGSVSDYAEFADAAVAKWRKRWGTK